MVTNYPGHIMQDHTDAYIIGKLDSILTIATKQVHKSRESLVYSDHYSKKRKIMLATAILCLVVFSHYH